MLCMSSYNVLDYQVVIPGPVIVVILYEVYDLYHKHLAVVAMPSRVY